MVRHFERRYDVGAEALMNGRVLFLVGIAVGATAPARLASAAACPNVMLVLDRSGSMLKAPDGSMNGTSKWELLRAAVDQVLAKHGGRLPFGLTMYASTGAIGDHPQCAKDVAIEVEPAHGTAKKILDLVAQTKPTGGTNTGDAIYKVELDPVMQDKGRGQYILLITDGNPNCNNGEPEWSYRFIEDASQRLPPIRTFVVGFDGAQEVKPAILNKMAMLGKAPQAGCNGADKPCYYSATNAQELAVALEKILLVITGSGEFGDLLCDDSCFTTGCPAGQVCTTDEFNLEPRCVPNPCPGGTKCASGEYCRYGKCVRPCAQPCGAGKRCEDGNCVADGCSGKMCPAGQLCHPASGSCVADPCAGKSCFAAQVCDVAKGMCQDDPCRIVVCPKGSLCRAGGNCEATSPGSTDGGMSGSSGCTAGGPRDDRRGGALPEALSLLGLLVLWVRRARAQHPGA
ncbi:MAG: VWA domain-containing protein [Myxococcales bacterium]|nr:VWA domain-containing protein [Myxococcales bacterium]